jgi:hypothetical protein
VLLLLFYYIGLPLLLLAFLPKLFKRFLPPKIQDDIRRLYTDKPIEKKYSRVVKRGRKGLVWLGDFETQMEAVDCAYAAKEESEKASEEASFYVLNDAGEALQEVDSK